jgi:hypothetical protein
LLVGIIIGLRYIPSNFSPIYPPDFSGLKTVQRLKAQSQLHNLAQLIPQYTLYRQKLPESFTELQHEGFIGSSRSLKDPWGSPFRLSIEQDAVVIRSETVLPGDENSLSITMTD